MTELISFSSKRKPTSNWSSAAPGRKTVDAAKAQVERAKAALQQIETQLAEIEVKAPADAFVEVLQVRPGELINPNSPVATLIELDRLWVRVYVPEPEKGNVHLGQEVSVTVDTFRGETFRGHRIARYRLKSLCYLKKVRAPRLTSARAPGE